MINIGSSYTFDGETYHSRINRRLRYTRQTSREDKMIDDELALNTFLTAFNCDIPLVGVWVL